MRIQIPERLIAAAILVGAVMLAAPGTARAEPNCTCRYAGKLFELATCACMLTPSGPRLACCDQVLNNTSWTFTGRSCPIANAVDVIPGHAAQQSLVAQAGPAVKQSLWPTVVIAE